MFLTVGGGVIMNLSFSIGATLGTTPSNVLYWLADDSEGIGSMSFEQTARCESDLLFKSKIYTI